jgi:hypothetical protein
MAFADPPAEGHEHRKVPRLDNFLDRLEVLLGEPCPVCKREAGWVAPQGFESVQIATGKQMLEALPYMCGYCGFLRVHPVSAYRPVTGTETTAEPTLADIAQIATELREADTQAEQLRFGLHAMIRALYDAGERPIRIAEAAGMTRQRVNQILNKSR